MARMTRFVVGVLLGTIFLFPLLSSQVAGAAENQTLTVKAGDTLWALGMRLGRTWEALAAWNHLPDPNRIFVGQLLSIPPAGWQSPVMPARAAGEPLEASRSVPRLVQDSQRPGPATTHVAPDPPASVSTSGSGVWGCIATHESGGNAAANTGNGFYGLYQDTLGSWRAAGGGPGLPSDYSASEQLAVNQRIQQQQGWGAWPVTSRMCGA
jgi:LysM repeat protein